MSDFMNCNVNLQDSIYARNKRRKLRLTPYAKKTIVRLASQLVTPTILDIMKAMKCDYDKAEILMKSIKIKRKMLSEHTGMKISGLQYTGKEGFLYIAVNRAYPGWIKCGMTIDCKSRLSAYNVGDPHNGFSFIATKKVIDRRKAERLLLTKVLEKSVSKNGEWFKIGEQDGIQILNEI